MRDFLLVSDCMVYLARNKINGKCYVGATDRGIPYRASRHKWNASHGQKSKFYTAIRKYGFDAFEFVPLMACATFFEALDNERRFIAEINPEYNLTSGGGGVKGLKFSLESRAKMSLAKKGKPGPWSNGKMPDEMRARLSRLATDRQKGKPFTGKRRLAVVENAKKANLARRRGVICLADGKRYESVTAAAQAYGFTTGQISWYCKGNHEGRRGLDFKYDGEQR